MSSASSSSLPSPTFRSTLANAARFWEPRRILYNSFLTTVVAVWLVVTWPHFRPALTWTSLLPMSVLALLANLCYCAAYLVDVPLQHSSLRSPTLLRWSVWIVGTLFALLVENYWIADEIYPDVR